MDHVGFGQDSWADQKHKITKGQQPSTVTLKKQGTTNFFNLWKPQNHVRNGTGRHPSAVWETRWALSMNAENTRVIHSDQQVSHSK